MKTVHNEVHGLRSCNYSGTFPAPAPGTRHQKISLNLAAALLHHTRSRNLGQVLQAPYNVILSKDNVVQPDILFIRRERTGLIGKRNLRGAPDLIIEIVDSEMSSRQLQFRRKIYAGSYVAEYWILDQDLETAEILLWSEIGYVQAGYYSSGRSGRLLSPLMAGFRPLLSDLF
jgi:Uma2 family endonuclease